MGVFVALRLGVVEGVEAGVKAGIKGGGVGGGGDESGVAPPSKVGQVVLHQQGLLLGGKRLSHLAFLGAPVVQACARRRQRGS